MFGSNKVYSVSDFTNENNLYVKDIFYTLQGEGAFSGCPAIFIRLGRCCLKCSFCDTNFDDNLQLMDIDEIIQKVYEIKDKYNHCKLIVITGGEPLLQPKSADLINELCMCDPEWHIQIETSGVQCPLNLNLGHENLYIVCSPKTSKIHERLIPRIDDYKYIISSDNYAEDDGLPLINYSTKVARPRNEDIGYVGIYISPMDQYDNDKNKKNLASVRDISLKYGYTVSLQIHKILGVE